MLDVLESLMAERPAKTTAKSRDISSKSNVTITRWNRVADYISLRINTDADCTSISARTNIRTERSYKKKNYVNEMIKMPSGATINVHLNELTYVRTIL